MNRLSDHTTCDTTRHTNGHGVRPRSTLQALPSPLSPRMKFALATGLVVLAASLAPMARAMAPADGDAGRHAQHHGGQHHAGEQHAGQHKGSHQMGSHHMGSHRMGGMALDGMGLGLGQGRQAERLLDSVGATAEQKAQIRQIGDVARADLQARRGAGAGLREQARTLMTQPTIDANAVEALRQQMLAQHDQTSQRMSQAMLEMARVLTPDQRVALSERMTERMNKRQELMQQRRAERLAAPAR